jgi:hypothetical protein
MLLSAPGWDQFQVLFNRTTILRDKESCRCLCAFFAPLRCAICLSPFSSRTCLQINNPSYRHLS